MKLTYLGTAAAEGWPAVFCNCPYCVKAKEKGGKNIRTRSQALVNGNLLIDFPMDSYMHMLQNKLDFSAVEHILFTHSHLDHCSPIDLFFRSEGCYAHNMTSKKAAIYGNAKVKERLDQMILTYGEERYGLGYTVIEPYKPVFFGDYKVTPLKANHMATEDALVFLIESGGSTLLYLHDTGLPGNEFYEYLSSNKVKADFISYDCTFVSLPGSGGHMGLDTCQTLRENLREIGVVGETTINCVNHFSHNGTLIYDELVPVAKEIGFETSYDGMSVEF